MIKWAVLCFAIVCGLAIWASIEEENACEARGGHIVKKGAVGYGGQSPVWTTTKFCISEDGRIIE